MSEKWGTYTDMQETSATAVAIVNTANGNLDGSGTITTLLTSPSGSALDGGTMLNYVSVKAIATTTEGMIRLFIDNGVTKYLFTEICIPATRQSNVQPALRTICDLQVNLQPGYSLSASTQNAETFNVMVDAANFVNCDCLG